MGIPFHETVRGAKFFDADFPRMIKATNRLAEATERSNALIERQLAPVLTPEMVFHDEMLERILKFVSEQDLDTEITQCQLVSLWTAYCILNDFECDTGPYDQALGKIWEAIQKQKCDDEGQQYYEWPESFEILDDFMCAQLV